MSDQDRYIPGVPCWIDTNQPDPEAAVAFYGGLFGWEFEDVTPPGAPVKYFLACYAAMPSRRRLAAGGVAARGGLGHVRVGGGRRRDRRQGQRRGRERAQRACRHRRRGTDGAVRRSRGAAFCLWQAKEHRGAGIVNEPGSLNFNDLSTRDLDRARAFYGAVFGWEVIDLGGSHAWALPGYGDFLEQRNPGMRAGMAELGAPERFEDVVASVAQITDDAPPHWGVTFAVDDADAIAARATELGGRVLADPFDAPWVRMTVIADPQGATFIASKFVPDNKSAAGA